MRKPLTGRTPFYTTGGIPRYSKSSAKRGGRDGQENYVALADRSDWNGVVEVLTPCGDGHPARCVRRDTPDGWLVSRKR